MNLFRFILPIFLLGGICFVVTAASPSVPKTRPPAPALAANPHLVLGNDACVKCHTSEVQVWKKTPHATTFDQLHRRPKAKQIAANLGLRSIKHEGHCASCHYTQKVHANRLHVIAGVACESCHGPAKNWLDIHHDYGAGGATRQTESPAHRQSRVARSVAAGMRNPMNVYDVAQSCLRCHTTADEQLVNVGGHSAGSLDFEFVSWSQGMVLHNFVQSDGQTNRPSSPERIRVMFVAGMIAELEASLRATAVATEKASYGVTVARRGARSVKRLTSVAAKIQSPTLDRILTVADGVSFKLNNYAQLIAAADQIAVLGHQFAEVTDGRSLAALDRFIPKGRK